jgi:hypothetical protein
LIIFKKIYKWKKKYIYKKISFLFLFISCVYILLQFSVCICWLKCVDSTECNNSYIIIPSYNSSIFFGSADNGNKCKKCNKVVLRSGVDMLEWVEMNGSRFLFVFYFV